MATVDLANMHLVEISLRNNVLVQCFFAPIYTDRACSYIRTLIASILIKDYRPFQQVWSCWIGVICHRYVPTFLLLFLLTANVYSDQFFTTCLNLFDLLQACSWFSKEKRIELRIKVVFHDKTSCILGIFQLFSFWASK